MNEEENLAPEPEEEQGEEQPSTPSPRGRSVFPYLAVLFATAFLLLLFAYLMQQRDSEEIRGNLSDLRESMGSIQSIDQLREENQALREQVERLEQELSSKEQELTELEEERSSAESMAQNCYRLYTKYDELAMALWHLGYVRALYNEGRLDEAREILAILPIEYGVDRVEYRLEIHTNLGKEYVQSDTFNPLEEWRALKAALLEEETEDE